MVIKKILDGESNQLRSPKIIKNINERLIYQKLVKMIKLVIFRTIRIIRIFKQL